ncbi:MAG: ATP-dependent DNA ligase, partial [Candidatus Bathyarchaeia archaeon]
LLYADGEDFTVKPYPERRAALCEAVAESDWVEISKQLVTSNPQEIENYLEEAVSDGCEGLMLKSVGPDSIYQAGARGWLWIKYKRAYRSEMADTVDLVVVGAFHGRGRRGGGYGALLLAAYDESADMFRTVCKCGSGFTDEDLEELPKKLRPLELPHRHPRVDSRLEADVWFTPSLVLEVTGDEITLSPVHTACFDAVRKGSGLAVRFPRFTGNYRLDKSPEDANTTDEILGMYRSQLKKIAA